MSMVNTIKINQTRVVYATEQQYCLYNLGFDLEISKRDRKQTDWYGPQWPDNSKKTKPCGEHS